MTRLALTRLGLSHFRSHRRSQLECDERPIAIFGPNGAGKTNILEAVSLMSPGRGLRRASAEEMSRRPEALGWKLTCEIDSFGVAHDIDIWSENGGARQLRVDGKAATQHALARINRVLWLVPAMDRLWIEGADGRRRFLDRMTLSFLPEHAEFSLAYEKAMRERNRLLKDKVQDAHWYRALETQMAEAGTAIIAHRNEALGYVAAAQSDAATEFPAADLALVDATETPDDPAALADSFARSRTADLAAGRTLIGPHRSDLSAVYRAKDMPAKECSTGEQKALLISLVLANARALCDQTGAPPLLLLDEVSAHLDAGRRAALYAEICALGTQAWMTGTGPELFEELGTNAQHFEVTDTEGVSAVKGTAL